MSPMRGVSGLSQIYIVLVLLLFGIGEPVLAFKCYSCSYRDGSKDPESLNCLRGNLDDVKTEDRCESCLTQIITFTETSKVNYLFRGCHLSQVEGCTENNGKEICFHLCQRDFCNVYVKEPPSTTKGPIMSTAPVFPMGCFNCTLEQGEEDTNYCRVVKAPTPTDLCDLRKCFTTFHVLVGEGNERNLTILQRGCGGDGDEDLCSGDSTNYTCSSYCSGHLCNHDPLLVLPNGPGGAVNAQTTISADVTLYLLTGYFIFLLANI